MVRKSTVIRNLDNKKLIVNKIVPRKMNNIKIYVKYWLFKLYLERESSGNKETANQLIPIEKLNK
jgi:hypothetical protein